MSFWDFLPSLFLMTKTPPPPFIGLFIIIIIIIIIIINYELKFPPSF